MRNTSCVGSCTLSSLKQLFSEHSSIIIAAGVLGALFGLFVGGIAWFMAGAAIGSMLAVTYGYIPRMADCVELCPIRQK